MTIEAQTSSIALLADGTGTPEDSIAADQLRGAEEIGRFIGETPKRVYYLVGRGYLKIGHLGSALIASRQTLREQYNRITEGPAEPPPQPPAPTSERRRSAKPPPPRRGRLRRKGADLQAASAAPTS
jgi:hypothetical protein